MTKPPLTARIREQLRKADDGLTARQLADLLGTKEGLVTNHLRDMPDTFIDRWTYPDTVRSAAKWRPDAVWCAVVPPADCPPPDQPQGVRVCE